MKGLTPIVTIIVLLMIVVGIAVAIIIDPYIQPQWHEQWECEEWNETEFIISISEGQEKFCLPDTECLDQVGCLPCWECTKQRKVRVKE